MKPFRFLADATEGVDGKTLTERARRAEDLGYDALVSPDHLLEMLAPIPAMAHIAAVTETLRIGFFVLNNDLRHPAVVAQDLATLDILSGGRLDVGIGAGWNVPEYEQTGIPFDPVGVRVSRLEEGIAVLKGLFADGPFSFKGTYYTITEMDGQPKPVQKPHPPFMIGGGGKRVLSLAGREADIVSLAPRIAKNRRSDPRSVTFEATAEKIDWVREAAGDRFDQIEFNIYPSLSDVIVTDDARGEAAKLQDRVRERTGVEMSIEDLLHSPQVYIGSLDGLTEKFIELREVLGITSIMVGEIEQLAPIVARLKGT